LIRISPRRILTRLAASLDGLSAENAALILTVGLVLGMFPIYGIPTLLCALASFILRLNFAGVQLVNQLATPLQLAMLVPFARLGARIVNSGPTTSLAGGLTASAVHAVAGWLCICLPLGVVLYFASYSALYFVRAIAPRQRQPAHSARINRLVMLEASIPSSNSGIS
jgi:hypothetical protein